MNNILEDICLKGLSKVKETNESLRIDNIIIGKSMYTINNCDKTFSDMNFCLVLLENGYGFSYFQQDITYDVKKYVNMDISEVLKEDLPQFFKVALIDSIYSIINRPIRKQSEVLFSGDLRNKAKERASKLMTDIPAKSKVLLLGGVSEFIEEAKLRDIELTVLDLEPEKINLEISSNRIISGKDYDLANNIDKIDYIIATGMIFESNTATDLFNIVNKSKTKLIMFMETGSNFGPQLLEYGADMVLSEYFPYYDFYDDMKYSIFRKTI